MHRGLKPLLALTGIVLAAGCAAPSQPRVTFYSHGESVAADPALYCDPTGQQCAQPPASPASTLRVPGNEPLQISVPGEVSAAPWQVAFIYRGADGAEVEGRSAVFAPGTRHSYTLRLPPDGTVFEHVEVQRFSAVLIPGTDGGVDFGIGGSWLLDVER